MKLLCRIGWHFWDGNPIAGSRYEHCKYCSVNRGWYWGLDR